MTKAEMTSAIHKKLDGDLSKGRISEVVEAVFDEMKKSVATDGSFRWNNFGTFTKKVRSARKGRNPLTGESLEIPERAAVTFKAASEFKDLLNS